MGLIENLRTKYVLQPLADYLVKQNEQSEDGLSKAAGGVLRDQLQFSQAQYGAQRSKPGTSIDFKVLRRFSVQYNVARAAINRRKRQLNQLDWAIASADHDGTKPNKKISKEVEERFKQLGGYRVRFRELLDLIVEDLLVLDAVALEKQYTAGNELLALRPLDAATIKLRVAEDGGTPLPPEIAYKQIIRGQEVATWDADEMYYEMLNPRTDTPYGLSPLESLMLTVSQALKSELFNLGMLTEGNIPEGLFGVPDSWTQKQIAEWQLTWDAALEGNQKAQSKLRFVPKGSYMATKKPEDMRYKELNEWLMQLTCMMFEIQPQELGFTDTVNKSTGEVQQDIGRSTGLKPLANFIEEIFTDVIQTDMGYPELRFSFMGLEAENEKETAEVNEILIRSGQRTVDEIRTDQGLKAIGVDKPFVMGNPTFIDADSQATRAEATQALINMGNEPAAAEPAAEDVPAEKRATPEDTHIKLVTELRAFRKYALNRVKAGKELRRFESQVLPEATVTELNKRLGTAETVEQVRDIFTEYQKDFQVDFLKDVINLRNNLTKVG